MGAGSIQTFTLLLALAALWGGSYLFVRIAAPEMGAIPLVFLRVCLAALGLLALVLIVRQIPNFRQRWPQFLLLGLLNNVIPMTLIASAVIHLTASLGAILNATTPLFTVVIATLWLRERFGWKKGLGVVLGIAGVGVLTGFSPIPVDLRTLRAVLEALLAAGSYGLAAVYARKAFQGVQALHEAVGQLCGSSFLLLPFALGTWPQVEISAVLVGAVLGLALLSTSIAYLLYFRLIATAGATVAASVTFLIPFFSILFGVVFLAEPLSAGMLWGLGIILTSVWLVLNN
jgi:drug/metabolite transporter (DMT)-like permease